MRTAHQRSAEHTRSTTSSSLKSHVGTSMMEKSLMSRTATATTRMTRCLMLATPLRMTMELVQPPAVSLPPEFALHVSRHHSQLRNLHAKLPPKAQTSSKRSLERSIPRSSLAVRLIAPPQCSSHSSSSSFSPKSVISIVLSSPSVVNSTMQNATVSTPIVVLTDFKTKSI